MDNDVRGENYTLYWLVAFERFNAEFYNITILEAKNINIMDISKKFELKNPNFIVAKAGIGIESRPREVKDLPHLYYFNY